VKSRYAIAVGTDLAVVVVIFTNIIMDYIFDEIQHDKHYKRKRENVKRSWLEVFLENEFEHIILYL